MTTTQIVIALTVLLPLIYDVYAVLKGGLHNTISWQVVQLSKIYPFIPFVIGILMGHFFTQMGC